MKSFKHLLFLSILCSLVLFTNCGEDSDDPVADDTNNTTDNANDGSNTDNGETETLIYLDENGVTIKANEEAVIGESYELDGVSYLVVDYDLLYSMIREDGDLTKVVTSKVTDMNNLFLNLNPNDNISITQSINSWDVSNVTNMSFMFFGSDLFFNEDISSWDVSSVINMEGMFSFSTTFNQDIGSWDVSNVTEMSRMFYSTVFNQDIGSWDVSNATSMSGMFGSVNEEGFASTSFNQDISSWDVNSVTDCEGFSEGTTAWTEPKPNFTNCLSGEESVWTGDVITFTKVDDADPTLATNQDRITDNVWITRDNAEGGQIYNLVSEVLQIKKRVHWEQNGLRGILPIMLL